MGPTHSCGPRDLRALSNVRIGQRAAELARGTRETRDRCKSVGVFRMVEMRPRRNHGGPNALVRSAALQNTIDRPHPKPVYNHSQTPTGF